MLTKSETRQMSIIRTHHALGNINAAALGLSALIRSTRKIDSSFEMMRLAIELDLLNHEDFII